MPNQNKQKKQKQNSGGQKQKSQSSTKLTKKQTEAEIYDPRSTLSGDVLKKFVKSTVRQQIKPKVSADRSTVKTLKKLLGTQTDQLKGLQKQSDSNISDYYKNLAQQAQQSVATSQALGARLSGDLAGAASQAQGGIGTAGNAATAALTADEQLRGGAPSSARDELAAIIAQQQGGAAREGAALQGYGNAQATTATNTLLGMTQAEQMRGAQTISDTNREIRNRTTDLQNQYAPDIRSALAEIKTTKASKGDLKIKALSDARAAERQYELSQAAVGTNRLTAKAQAQNYKAQAQASKKAVAKSPSGNPTLDVAKQYGKNKAKEQARSLQNQIKVLQQQGANKHAEQIQSLKNQLKVAKAQAQGNGTKGKGYTKSEYLRAKDLANARLNLDAITNQTAWTDSIATLVNGGAKPEAARAYLRKVAPFAKTRRHTKPGTSSINAILGG